MFREQKDRPGKNQHFLVCTINSVEIWSNGEGHTTLAAFLDGREQQYYVFMNVDLPLSLANWIL